MDVSTTMLIASLTGFLFGGLLGARHAGDKYILMNHSAKYTSTMQAQVSSVWYQERMIKTHKEVGASARE